MNIFIAASTIGKGTVPKLPMELRKYIIEYTFPRPVLWCSVWITAIAFESFEREISYKSTYWSETPRCYYCSLNLLKILQTN